MKNEGNVYVRFSKDEYPEGILSIYKKHISGSLRKKDSVLAALNIAFAYGRQYELEMELKRKREMLNNI